MLVVLLSTCAAQRNGRAKTAKAELSFDKGYAEDKKIYFMHTEDSNADVAEKMAALMGSPVLQVPSLASVSEDALANVYTFTNGVKGESMSGCQLSVFDNASGTEGYTPLRLMSMVTWVDETKARELKTAADVLAAAKAGELTIKQTPVVINMPFAVWDGGQR